MEKKKVKQIRGLILFTAAVVLTIFYFESVMDAGFFILHILQPFIIGGVIAFIINIPMKSVENKLLKKWNGKSAQKLKRPVSLVLALIFIVLLIYIVIQTVVPQLYDTTMELGKKIPPFMEKVMAYLEKICAENPDILKKLEEIKKMEIDWNSLFDSVFGFMKKGVGSVLLSTVSMAGTIIGTIINVIVAIIFSFYILLQKEKLGRQGRSILKAYCKEKNYLKIHKVLSLLAHNFTNFVTGQCLEAVILGTMFMVTMLILRMDYAVLVGVLIAFTALIPIVGAFIGCVVGAFLLAINNPMTAVWFVVMFLILQQIEGNLIYPKVVGNSVGLPSIWVLVAVSVGGSLFGIPGILVFIPLISTIYALLKEDVSLRNEQKKPIATDEKEEIKKEKVKEKVEEKIEEKSEKNNKEK